jgi:hypothetical protein
LIGRFHNPESSFLGVLSDHFETVEIGRKEIGDRYEVVVFGKTAALLVQVFPHVIFATEIPATREVVIPLEAFHCLYCFEMCSIDIKEHIPVISTFDSGKAIELKRVHDTLVLMT